MKIKNLLKISILPGLIYLLSSCSTILNPYEEEFTCPGKETGSCKSLQETYQQDTEGKQMTKTVYVKENRVVQGPNHKGGGQNYVKSGFRKVEVPVEKVNFESKDLFRENYYKMLNKNFSGNKIPLQQKGKVLRVVFESYQSEDKKIFYQERTSFVRVQDPQWILEEEY